MTRILRALALAGAMAFASSSTLAQQYAPGSVLGNGTATNPSAARVTDVLLVLKQKAGTSACVFRESAGSVACGTIATGGIADAAVTDAKISNRTALSVFGRSANSSGVGADMAAGTDGHVMRRSGTSLGFGLLASGAFATGPGIVTPAMLDNAAALTLLGRSANSSGVRADIAAVAGSSCAFRESSSAIGCGTLATAAYAANSVTNAKLAQMANATVKCRTTAGTGDAEDCTATQTTALLNAMVGDSGSGGTKGLAPAPGAGDAAAAKFLKADGTWAVPAGGGGSGMATAERQNFALSLIYQSKAFAGYRRLIHLFSDGFKASDGISSALSLTYTLDTTNGRLTPSTTTGTMISAAAGVGQIGDMTSDGGLAAAFNGGSNALFTASATRNSGGTGYVGKNYTGTPKQIGTIKVYGTTDAGFDGTSGATTITLTVYGKNGSLPGSGTDGTVLVTETFADSNSIVKTLVSTDQTTSWDYVWVRDVSSLGTFVAISEIEFYAPDVINNMVATTTPQTASSSRSSARVLLEFNPVDSITLNTDLVVHVTCALSTATVTISNASPGVITHTAHGLSANDPVYFTTSGSLPTGLTASTQYFVKTVNDANTYTVSATMGGSVINTSSAGSGTHTANYYLWASATLSSAGTGQAGRTVAETSSTSCTASGTTFAARIKSLNSKSLQVYGVTLDLSYIFLPVGLLGVRRRRIANDNSNRGAAA